MLKKSQKYPKIPHTKSLNYIFTRLQEGIKDIISNVDRANLVLLNTTNTCYTSYLDCLLFLSTILGSSLRMWNLRWHVVPSFNWLHGEILHFMQKSLILPVQLGNLQVNDPWNIAGT